MEKKIITVLLMIALFIPSFIAIGYYSSTKAEPEDSKAVSSISIEDLNGTKWELSTEDGNPDSVAIIDLFIAMKTNATSVAAIPEAIADDDFFLVTLTSFGNESVYKYFFTTSPADAYLVDSTGAAYKISETDAAQFLSTQYSASLYGETTTPMLIVGGTSILPATWVWNYATYDGTFMPLDTTGMTSSDVKTCVIDGGLELGFSDTPDYVKLTVKNGEEVIFSDTVDRISELSLDGIGNFTVDVSAEWYQTSDKSFYGSATYTFAGDIVEPAVFYIGQTTVENGKFVCIGGKNVDDVSKITFTSEPSINYTPTFFAEGEYVYALVPISYDLEDGTEQNYAFTITYGNVSQTMNLTVTSYKYGSSSSAITQAIENATYSESARTEAESVLREIANSEVLTTHAFDGVFLEDVVGANSTDKISPGFGRYITVSETGTKFRHTGVDYNVAKGTSVMAVNAGEVVYSGYLATTGYIVVVDHGWGLKSWYCHLSECAVKEGDTVGKGDVIGAAGDTGFAAKNRTHVGLTVFDVPVCIYQLWESPVAIPSME